MDFTCNLLCDRGKLGNIYSSKYQGFNNCFKARLCLLLAVAFSWLLACLPVWLPYRLFQQLKVSILVSSEHTIRSAVWLIALKGLLKEKQKSLK